MKKSRKKRLGKKKKGKGRGKKERQKDFNLCSGI